MNELEKRDELVDDAVHKASKLMDRFNQRLRLNNLRLVERYVKGELHLLISFTVRLSTKGSGPAVCAPAAGVGEGIGRSPDTNGRCVPPRYAAAPG